MQRACVLALGPLSALMELAIRHKDPGVFLRVFAAATLAATNPALRQLALTVSSDLCANKMMWVFAALPGDHTACAGATPPPPEPCGGPLPGCPELLRRDYGHRCLPSRIHGSGSARHYLRSAAAKAGVRVTFEWGCWVAPNRRRGALS